MSRLAVGLVTALSTMLMTGGMAAASAAPSSPSASVVARRHHPAPHHRPKGHHHPTPHRRPKGHHHPTPHRPPKGHSKPRRAVKPVVSSLSAHPSRLGAKGGFVTLTGRVLHASGCIVTATPHLGGFPRHLKCSNGIVRTRLKLPASSLATGRKFSFTLKAVNGRLAGSKTTAVLERPAPPTAGGLVAQPSTLASGGGSILLSDHVSRAHSCRFSSSPSLSGLPKTIACKSGTVSLSVSIPASTKATSYQFALEVSGPGGSLSRTTAADQSGPGAPLVGTVTADPTSLGVSGGSVALSTAVTEATSCTYSVSPAITGFSGSAPCSSGTAALSVTIPANQTANAETYSFTLTASGPGGTTSSASPAKVTVAAPLPTVGAVTASPATLAAGGGSISLSTPVTDATSCTYSASPAITGFSGTVSCASGTAAVSVAIPANETGSTERYSFSLAASGPGGTASSSSPATVSEPAEPPTAGAVTADPTALESAGGSVSLSTPVTSATSCTYSVSPAITGFSGATPCSSGTAELSVAVPANPTASAVSYVFSLTATGSGGTTGSSQSATVTEAAAPPTVGAVEAKPSTLASSGGSVSLTTSVSNASSCTYSVSPAITGFSGTVSCASGTASLSVTLPSNTTGSTESYTFSLVASGPGGTTSSLSPANVAVEPPAPTVGAVTASPTALTYAGGSVSLTTSVSNASSCTYSVSPAITGFSGATSCSSGTAQLSVAVPANPTGSAVSYLFSLTATNSGGTTGSSQSATVTEAAEFSLAWSSGSSPEPPPVDYTLISCPTTGFCAAADTSAGNVVTVSGSSWSRPTQIEKTTGNQIITLSCASSLLCLASDGSTLWLYNGTSWSATTPPSALGSYIDQISCAPGGDCTVIGGSTASGGAVESTTDGSNWQAEASLPSGYNPYSLSCPSSTACDALLVSQSSGSLSFDTFTPTAGWTPGPSLPSGTIVFNFSCGTASFCALTAASSGSNPDFFVYNGNSWTAENPSGVELLTLNCTSASQCFSSEVDPTTGAQGVWQYSASTTSWGALADGTPPLTASGSGLSCVSSSFCGGVSGGMGEVLQQGAWTSATLGWQNTVTAISCPTASFCMAGDSGGDFETYDGTNGTWSSPVAGPVASGDFGGISCPSATFCAAVISGALATWSSSSGSWTVSSLAITPSPVGQGGVSCTSSSFCVAVSGSQASIYDNGTWASPSSIDSTNGDLASVSCTSTTYCVALDASGAVRTYNGSGWSSTPTTIDSAAQVYYLASISCITAGVCVAVDQDGNAEILQGGSWSSPTQLAGGGALGEVACNATAGDCVISGQGGVYYVQETGGSYAFNQTPESVGAPGDYWSLVSCSASSCVVVSEENTAEYGS